MKAVGEDEKSEKMVEGGSKLKENVIGKIVEQETSENVNLFKNMVVNA